MQREDLRPLPASQRRNPFTCGLNGTSYTHDELFSRSENLAKSLSQNHGWNPATGSSWDKVVCIFSLNSVSCTSPSPKRHVREYCKYAESVQIDYLTVAYATHRLSGIVTPANAVYTVEELTHQLVSSGAKVLFTCASLFDTARKAAEKAGIPREDVYLIQIPREPILPGGSVVTLDQLIEEGNRSPLVEPLVFSEGQGARQTAFLCYSSGTSGQPVRNFAGRIRIDDGLTAETESGHDLALQRHRQCNTTVHIRVGRAGSKRRNSSVITGSSADVSHLRSRGCIACCGVEGRWLCRLA